MLCDRIKPAVSRRDMLRITAAGFASYCAAPHSAWEFGAALAVMRMLPAPVLAIGLLLAVFIAPNRTSRWMMLIAAGTEGSVAAYAVLHWFVGCCFI